MKRKISLLVAAVSLFTLFGFAQAFAASTGTSTIPSYPIYVPPADTTPPTTPPTVTPPPSVPSQTTPVDPSNPFTLPTYSQPTPEDVPRSGEAAINGFVLKQATVRSALKIHFGMDSNSGVALEVRPGDVILLVGAPRNNWQMVKVGSVYGFIPASQANKISQITVPANAKIYSVRATAMIRYGTGPSAMMGFARQGTSIAVIGETATHYKVSFAARNGFRTGYIAKSYLTAE